MRTLKKHMIAFVLMLTISLSCSEKKEFRFGVFSDTHIMEGTTAAADLRMAVHDANTQNLDFVLVSGDITDMNVGGNLQVAKTILDSLNCPYYIIPGNHDTKWSGSGGYNFVELWGDDKFAFEHGGYAFIGFHQGPVVRMDDGHISSGDLIWLEKVLADLRPQTKPVILVTHYPVDPSVDNWYELTERLEPYNVKLVIHGHGHRNRRSNYEGLPAVMVRSTLRARNPVGGYAIAEVKQDSIYFSERLYDETTKPVWAKLSLENEQVANPNMYERPDFSVNDSFPQVKTRWTYETKNTMTASPLIHKNKVYVGNASGTMYCFDLKSGQKMWTYTCDGPIYADAAAKNDLLVFPSADSCVYALNTETGKKIWQFKTEAPVISVPVIHETMVLFGGSDGSFRALDLESGEQLWAFNRVEAYVETKPLIYQDKAIFGAWDESVYALNLKDGSLAWKWQDGRPGQLYSPAACWPVAYNGIVYIVAPDRYLSAIDAESGETLWRTNRHKVRETIGISSDGKTVFARCMRDTVFAIQAGKKSFVNRWVKDYNYGYDIAPSMPQEIEGTLYFGTKNGLIVSSNANDGELFWKYKLHNALINTVAPVDGNRVVVSNMDGIVVMLDSAG